MSAQCNT